MGKTVLRGSSEPLEIIQRGFDRTQILEDRREEDRAVPSGTARAIPPIMKTTKATRIEFVAGFIDGLKMFEAGATLESIADVKSGSAFDRGLFAASEALNGWIDGAEHEARKCGFAREEARIEIAALIRPTVAQ